MPERSRFPSEDKSSRIEDSIRRYAAASLRLTLAASTRDTLQTLMNALEKVSGIFLVTGNPGIGKSVFAAHLQEALRSAGHLAILVDCADVVTKTLLERLSVHSWPVPAPETKRSVVLIADAAESLPKQTLASLLQMEARQAIPIRVVMVGRPVLERHIQDPGLKNLIKFVRFQTRLRPLDEADVLFLVRQMTTPGHRAGALTNDTIDMLVHQSEGRPDQVKLLWTYAQGIAEEAGEAIPRKSHLQSAVQMLRPRAWDDAAGVSGHIVTGAAMAVASRHIAGRRGAERAAPNAFSGRRMTAYIAIVAVFALLGVSAAWLDGNPSGLNGGAAIEQARNISRDMANEALNGETAREPISERPPTTVPENQSSIASQKPDKAVGVAPPHSSAPVGIEGPTQQPNAKSGQLAQEAAPTGEQHAVTPLRSAALRPVITASQSQTNLAHKREAANRRMRFAQLNSRSRRYPDKPVPSTMASFDRAPQIHQQKAETSSERDATAESVASTQPRCEPYVSNIDFARRSTNVQGTACRDSSGTWWITSQQLD